MGNIRSSVRRLAHFALASVALTALGACAIEADSLERDEPISTSTQAASTTTFIGAWWVDSASAVTTLRASGFNTFIVPSAAAFSVGPAVNAGENMIIMLTDYTSAGNVTGAQTFVDQVKAASWYGKVWGFLTFDEPNAGANPVPLQTQRDWANRLFSWAPGRNVIEDFLVTDCGVPNSQVVDKAQGVGPNYSYTAAMLNFYPFHPGWSQSVAEYYMGLAAQQAKNYFASTNWMFPINQAAYSTTWITDDGACGSVGANNLPDLASPLAPIYTNGMSMQYEKWKAAGLMTQSHGLVYFGWKSAPYQPGNLSSDSSLRHAACVQGNTHKAYFGGTQVSCP